MRNDIRPLHHEDPQITEAFTSVQEALDSIPQVSYRWIRGFVASGTAGTEMPGISWDETTPPDAAIIVRAVPHEDRTGDAAFTPRLNFYFVSRDKQIVLYEPSGMTADKRYDLLIQFVTGVN